MLFNGKERSVNEFAQLIGKMEAAEFLGLAKILCVKMFYDDIKDENGKPMPRSGEAIVEDCLVKFYSLNRAQRKEIIKVCRAAIKGKK